MNKNIFKIRLFANWRHPRSANVFLRIRVLGHDNEKRLHFFGCVSLSNWLITTYPTQMGTTHGLYEIREETHFEMIQKITIIQKRQTISDATKFKVILLNAGHCVASFL